MVRQRRRVAALAALVLLLGVGAGCTGSDDQPESAPSEPGRPLETMGSDGLPEDYPRDEVPLVEGEVTSVEPGAKDDPGYAVSILTDDSPEAAIADAVDLLESAGWATTTDGGASAVQVLTKGQDQVIITNTVTSGRTLINYAVNIS
jgi:hypothetical protein